MNVILTDFVNPYENYIEQYDVKTYTQVLESVSGVISVVMGVAVVLLAILAAITTAVDVVYLVLPGTRNKIMEWQDRINREGKHTVHFSIASKQAIDANRLSAETGKNKYIIYLQKRSFYYVILAVVMFMMLVGWTSIVKVVARLIVGVLKGLGFV